MCKRRLTVKRFLSFLLIGSLGVVVMVLQLSRHDNRYAHKMPYEPSGAESASGIDKSGISRIRADGSVRDQQQVMNELKRLQNDFRVLDKPKSEKIVKINPVTSEDERLMNLFQKEQEKLQKQDSLDPFLKDPEPIEKFDFSNYNVKETTSKYDPKELRTIVEKHNQAEKILNLDRFPSRPKDGIVIVVQVHRRIMYFKELLASLQNAKGVEDILLVISHDFYCDEMMELVSKIKFCQVIQIFYPRAIQMYENEFPGTDPKDCPRDIKKPQALRQGCLNAQTPDKYGHYREAKYTVTKHHWWWKANTVFDKLNATKSHNGPVIFLEEDHYVAPSMLDALKKLDNIRRTEKVCQNSCDIITMGNYENTEDFRGKGKDVLRMKWMSSKHNMGMTLYRDTWNRLKNLAHEFCQYDDYNWDWTLLYLSLKKIGKPLDALVVFVPRIFHVGDCGLHHTKNCNSHDTLNKVKGILERQKNYLFPHQLRVVASGAKSVIGPPNGGWGDVRDHQLCLSFVQPDRSLLRR